MKCKVCGKECGKYAVCWDHRETKYKDICKIHGETWFINRQCIKCQIPVYNIVNNKDRKGKKITQRHFLYPYLDRLTNYDKSYQKQFQRRISNCAGVYGIFYNNTCLYVGQSFNITNRISQHKKNIIKVQNQLKGVRIHKKRVNINKVEHKVEFKYYELAKSYRLSDLSYKTLFVVPRLDNDYEFTELLTYAEQAMINTYKPKFNHMAARPTILSKNKKGN